eukprot:985763-Prymnesium_polylepis.1
MVAGCRHLLHSPGQNRGTKPRVKQPATRIPQGATGCCHQGARHCQQLYSNMWVHWEPQHDCGSTKTNGMPSPALDDQ